MPGNKHQPVDDFYSAPVGRPTFTPAAAGAGQNERRPTKHRSAAPTLIKLAVTLAVVGGAAYWGVPPAVAAVQEAETRSLTSDLDAIAQAEIQHYRQRGYFSDSLAEIAGETSVNQVQVVTADATHLCLKATPLLHQAPLYFTPRSGITTVSCE